MASGDAKPIPQKNVAYRVTFPILDADGDLVTGATTPDSEISKDGGTFADCTNEITEIATASGMYFLDLTSTEMNADTVALIIKTATAGAKTTPIVLYPQEADDLRVAVTHWVATAVATPTVNGVPEVDVTHVGGTVQTAGDIMADTNDIQTRLPAALVSGRIDASVGAMAANVLTATAINADAITAAKIAPDAIGASELAADAVTEIQAGLATPTNITGGTITTVTNLTNAPTAGDLTATMKASVQAECEDAIVAKNLDKLVLLSGTADSGSTTTLVDAALTQADNDWWKGRMIVFTSGTLLGQCAIVTDFVAATDTITFAPPVTAAVSTHTYVILPGVSAWDDTIAEHLIAGSTGAALNAIDDFLDTEVAAILAAVDTEVAAIKSKTDQLTFTAANQIDANALSMANDLITSSKIAADAIGASELAADAANEIRDAVWAKAMTELSAVPGVTGNVLEALQWIFLLSRNKIPQTATTQLLRNDADSATIGTSTVSDDGTTFIRGKFA